MHTGTYKVRNEIETKRNEINENETKRNETKSTK
jgi:cell division protein FtsL